MLEILLYSYLTSIHIYICGYIFFYIAIDREVLKKSNIFELFFYGAFFLSLIALFLNFFLSLNKILNTFLFFFPFLLILFIFNKSFFKKIIYYSFPIAILFCLTISYDGTYRPDAGSYHLPFISILNENKILIGINNIHFRFGHTSIIQYLSAIYNNYIFTEKGILIPSGLIYCNFVGYCIYGIFQNKNRNFHKILIFILLIFVIFRVNRYSDFGNDAPANLIFFYLIIESTRDSKIFLKIKKTIFASTFIFLNKITLLFAFLIPIYFIFKNFRIKRLVNKISITCLLFIILYTGKNILISGCIMFPVEQTCISKLFWYDKNSNRASNAVNARLENEAWTKGWMDQSGNKKNYEQFLINFNWTKTWVSSEGKKIIKKTFPFFVFLLILYILLLYSEKLIIQKDEKKIKLPNEYYLCAIVSIFGSILWFLKFPVFRYGYGYLISLISIIILLNIKNFKIIFDDAKLIKALKYTLIILLIGISSKNLIRISKNSKLDFNVWPNIYNSGNKFEKLENLKIKKDNETLFYKSKISECYYSKSPCTHFYNGNDFTLDEIDMKIVYGYKIYYFIR